MVTCDSCLEGRHRRCPGCSCTVCHTRPPTTMERIKRAKANNPKPKPPKPSKPSKGSVGKPGRPRVWANDQERNRMHMRRVRAVAKAARIREELITDPGGASWSIPTRRAFNLEVQRLKSTIYG